MQTQDESSEDWWYDIEKIYDNGTHVGYITTGFSRWVNQQWEESENATNKGCGVIPYSYNYDSIVDWHQFETLNYKKGMQRGTIARYDLAGNMLWCKPFQLDEMFDIKHTSDGGFLAVGRTRSSIDITTGSNETPLKYNPVNSTSNNHYGNLSPCFTLGTNSEFVNFRTIAIKLDSDGDSEWHHIYGYEPYTGSAADLYHKGESKGVEETSNGYILVGTYSDDNGANKIQVIVVDQNGYLKNKYIYEEGEALAIARKGTTNNYAVTGISNGKAFIMQLEYNPTTFSISRSWSTPKLKVVEPNGSSWATNLIYNSAGKIIVPVIKNCTKCGGPGDSQGKFSFYEVDPSTGVATEKGVDPSDPAKTIQAFDLQIGVTQTSDGGYAFISSRRKTGKPDPDISDYFSGNSVTDILKEPLHFWYFYLNPDKMHYWETDAYVLKYDSQYNKQWEKTFDINNNPPTAFPGDIKKSECVYRIVEADAGGLVGVGNNSVNFDDSYLFKLGNGCTVTSMDSPTSYTIHAITRNPTLFQSGVYSVTNWSTSTTGDKQINGKVTVPAGAKLVIDGIKVEFTAMKDAGEITGIIVERGGLLEVKNGAQLTVIESCDKGMWGGIIVKGQSGQYWPNAIYGFGNQGKCVINDATISHAVIGILAGSDDIDPSIYKPKTFHSRQGGGIIKAEKTDFINCETGIQFVQSEYSKKSLLSNYVNQSFIKECKFITNAALRDDGLQTLINNERIGSRNKLYPMGIKITEVDGVIISGCEFKNTYQDQYGCGIFANDAKFKSIAVFNGQGFPTKKSKFSNLFNGVLTYNTKSINTCEVSFGDFEGCNNGVHLSNVDYSKVNYNTFKNTRRQYNYYGDAVYFHNCTGYQVEKNIFSKNTTSNDLGIWGVTVYNRNFNNRYNTNYIRDNTFNESLVATTGLKYNRGGKRVTSNSPKSGGLDFICNTYNNNQYDILSTMAPGASGLQGAFSSFDNESPAGNLFDGCTVAEGEIENGASNIIYYHHSYSGSGSTPIPSTSCYSPGSSSQEVDAFNVQLSWDRVDACPSNFWTNVYSGSVKDLWVSELVNWNSGAQQQSDNYNNTIDGGNTTAITDLVVNDATEQELSDELQNIQPYLSDEVLLSLLNDKPTPLSDNFIQQQFLPNCPLSDEVLAAIFERTPAIGDGAMNALMAAQTGVSEREKLASERDWYFHQAEYALNRVISELLLDTVPHSPDTLIHYLSTSNNTNHLANLSDYYIDSYNETEAVSSLSNFSGLDEWNNYVEFSEYLLQARVDSIAYDTLLSDTTVLIVHDSLLADTIDPASMSAYTFDAIYGGGYLEPIHPPLPDTSGSQIIADDVLNSSSESENVLSKAEESSVVYGYQVFPNPAKNQVHLVFNDHLLNETTVQIIDQKGKVISTSIIKAEEKQLHTDLSDVRSGVYYVRVQSSSEAFAPTKLIITR